MSVAILLDLAEQRDIQSLRDKIDRLREYLISQSPPESTASIAEWYAYLNTMKEIQGNTSNGISFIGCLMAKEYLEVHLSMQPWSVSKKAQGASGLDIDERTTDGKRVVGEVKTTLPHLIKDLGAAQKKSFRDDFAKLNLANADFKFFFVTEAMTFQVIQRKYAVNIPEVKVILLTTGEEYQADKQ